MQRFFTVLMMLMLAVTFTFANGEGETAGAQKTADLVYVNWEEGVAYTHLAQVVLEDKMGYDVTITAADVAPGYAAIAQGDKDAFMETWLPVLHKSYIEKYSDQIVDLGHVFEGTESGLVIPQYMADAGISTVSDLLKPEAQEKLDKTITGIDAGAGVMITTEEEVMTAYGLTDAGYELLPSSGPAMMASLKDAIVNEEWIVVTGWKPHSMFGYWDLTFLEQDKDQVWGVGNIHIFGRKNIAEDKPELAQFLKNMSMTNSELGSLMVHINESNLDTLEAAREWMNENEDVVADWIP
jgi:glycine betaine/proline transport system substrate-binding protein